MRRRQPPFLQLRKATCLQTALDRPELLLSLTKGYRIKDYPAVTTNE